MMTVRGSRIGRLRMRDSRVGKLVSFEEWEVVRRSGMYGWVIPSVLFHKFHGICAAFRVGIVDIPKLKFPFHLRPNCAHTWLSEQWDPCLPTTTTTTTLLYRLQAQGSRGAGLLSCLAGPEVCTCWLMFTPEHMRKKNMLLGGTAALPAAS